jgi:hypothetical protein
MAEQAYQRDTKGMRLADLADGLLNGVWASDCATASECTAKTVELENSEDQKDREQLWT